MDFEVDFMETVRHTIAELQRRGVAHREFAYDGRTVNGWSIESVERDKKEGTEGKGYWSTFLQRGGVAMTTTGEFWNYGFWLEEEYRGSWSQMESTREEFLRPVTTSYFIGSEGEPFSKWKEKLARLPYAS